VFEVWGSTRHDNGQVRPVRHLDPSLRVFSDARRCTTAGLLCYLSTAYPSYALLFQGLLSLDFSSHYVHMYRWAICLVIICQGTQLCKVPSSPVPRAIKLSKATSAASSVSITTSRFVPFPSRMNVSTRIHTHKEGSLPSAPATSYSFLRCIS